MERFFHSFMLPDRYCWFACLMFPAGDRGAMLLGVLLIVMLLTDFSLFNR